MYHEKLIFNICICYGKKCTPNSCLKVNVYHFFVYWYLGLLVMIIEFDVQDLVHWAENWIWSTSIEFEMTSCHGKENDWSNYS